MEEINYPAIATQFNEVVKKRNSYWFYGQIRSVLPFIKKLVTTLDIEELKFNKLDLSVGKMQTYVLDFLYDLDPELEEKVANVLEDLKGTLLYVGKPTEKGGENFVGLRKTKKNTVVDIQIHPRNDSTGILVVGHEYGHLLSQRIQQHCQQKTDCLGEIESLFIERLFADWLLKKGFISKEERKKFDTKWKNNLLGNARGIYEEWVILSNLKQPTFGDDLRSFEQRLISDGKLSLLDLLKKRMVVMIKDDDGQQKHGEYMFRYVVGEIVAEALYQEYKKEPDLTLARFKEFLAHNAEYEFFKKKQVNKDGQVVENLVLDKAEMQKCFTTLLGEDYKAKLTRGAELFIKEKTV